MFLRYVLPIVALGLLGFAVSHAVQTREVWSKSPPPIEPPSTSLSDRVAGAGVLEAQTENIAIGAPETGVVVEVFVKVGHDAAAGAALFRLDDRHLQAELKVREAHLSSAQAELKRLEHQPRPEELPVKDALVREAEANFTKEDYELNRIRRLAAQGSATDEELQRTEQAFRVAEAQLERVRAELALLKGGSWEYDQAVAVAAVQRAEAQVEQVKTELERLVIRAPVEGQVLQVNVRPGEYTAAPGGSPLIVLGNIRQLHVRVDIDEHDIPRFKPGAPARAMLKGSPRQELPLTFVRVEPFVIPKRSLTGLNVERVDTRVLQIIYSVNPEGMQLYVGQQLDVYIDASDPAR